MSAGVAQPESESPRAPELTVNGDGMTIEETGTIGELLARLKIRPERVIVEHNGVIHKRGEGLETPIGAGDVLEIVHFVGGG